MSVPPREASVTSSERVKDACDMIVRLPCQYETRSRPVQLSADAECSTQIHLRMWNHLTVIYTENNVAAQQLLDLNCVVPVVSSPARPHQC